MTTTTPDLLPSTTLRPRGLRLSLFWGRPTTSLILLGIVLLALALNIINLAAIGDGNLYYTAAVKSMLQSPSNFFFVAAEPGGSVSVDKPPLGLWLQAISALIFGVNGFAVTLPQILAGVLAVPLLYHLVSRYFGVAAGLIAAFVLAVTPVSIAVQRNNTMDATLIFTLLLAAWAFLKATDTGRLRWLLWGGVLVGLGFNIKMLQAFLPVPAFYALYFLGARVGWWRKIAHLAATSLVLVAVSFAWVIVVDLTPADQRPYVGSSETNSALELAIGYNGLERLLGGVMGGGQGGGQMPPAFASGNVPVMPGDAPGSPSAPPAGVSGQPPAFPGNAGAYLPRDGAGGFGGGEIGQPGVLRLLTTPLANEISWLLPFGLFSVVLLAGSRRLHLPLAAEHRGLVLWGVWLLTEVIFFSVASFYHAYYLAMLAPPLAALVGIGLITLWRMRRRQRVISHTLLLLTAAATVLFQLWVASQYITDLWWAAPAAALLLIGGLLLVQRVRSSRRLAAAGFTFVVLAMTAIPAVWAGLTTLDTGTNTLLPHAYAGEVSAARGPGMFTPRTMDRMGGLNTTLLDYLEANTQDTRYLMAVPSSNDGDVYVLATGRPVLYMGGFRGVDPVVDAADLQRLVEAGDLRFVLWGNRRGPAGLGQDSSSDISAWLQSSCAVVNDVSTGLPGTLYRCGD